jgi:hypothetical protein
LLTAEALLEIATYVVAGDCFILSSCGAWRAELINCFCIKIKFHEILDFNFEILKSEFYILSGLNNPLFYASGIQ